MSGLEKIIDKIHEENNRECAQIISDADKKAKKIKSDEIAAANVDAETIIKKAKEQCALTDEKAKSGAALLEKKIRLEIKNKIIGETVNKVKNQLKGLEDAEYFALIERLIKAYAKEGEGTLEFSASDLKRIPDGFEKKINSSLPDGAVVKISNTPIETDGGFILSYEDIEENCTFDALIETNIDAVRDKLNAELFS